MWVRRLWWDSKGAMMMMMMMSFSLASTRFGPCMRYMRRHLTPQQQHPFNNMTKLEVMLFRQIWRGGGGGMTKFRQANHNQSQISHMYVCMSVCMYAALFLSSLAAESAFSPREQQKRDANPHWKLVVYQTEEGSSSSSRVSPPKFLKFANTNKSGRKPNPNQISHMFVCNSLSFSCCRRGCLST